MTSRARRAVAAGLVIGLGLGAAGSIPASANPGVPAVGGVVGAVDGGLLDGLVGSLLHGEGGIFGNEGGVLAGDDELGDVVGGFASESGEVVGAAEDVVVAVGEVVADPDIGGEDSFGDPTVGSGLLGPVLGEGGLGGVLGGLLSGGTGLLGGVF